MMAIPHILGGAAIAKVLRRPALAYPAAFASHLVFDHIPHLDVASLFGGPDGKVTPLEAGFAMLDLVVGGALLWLIIRGQPARRLLAWGGLCGILLDLLNYCPGVGGIFRTWPGTAWLSHLHAAAQAGPGYPWPLEAGTQLAVVVAAVWILTRPAARPPEELEAHDASVLP